LTRTCFWRRNGTYVSDPVIGIFSDIYPTRVLIVCMGQTNVTKLSHPKIAASDFADGVILTWT